MSKETFGFDIVLRVEIDVGRSLNPEEVEALGDAVGKVLSPYSPARDNVVAGLGGCLPFVSEHVKVNAWFELPWAEKRETT